MALYDVSVLISAYLSTHEFEKHYTIRSQLKLAFRLNPRLLRSINRAGSETRLRDLRAQSVSPVRAFAKSSQPAGNSADIQLWLTYTRDNHSLLVFQPATVISILSPRTT